MDINEVFWQSSLDNVKKGYIFSETKGEYICLLCGEIFEEGFIYNLNEKFMTAEKAVKEHIFHKHGSVLEYLLNMDKKYTGITDIQKELITMFSKGVSDKEIARLQQSSDSTIRTQRFALREKAKQAKIYLSIIELMEQEMNKEPHGKTVRNNEKLIEIHRGAKMVDERYAITNEEKEITIKTYFLKSESLKLKSFPTKEKKKIVVLQKIAEQFKLGIKYSEAEVNGILKDIYEDFATIRRYLIEYGFMDRTKDCSEYWING